MAARGHAAMGGHMAMAAHGPARGGRFTPGLVGRRGRPGPAQAANGGQGQAAGGGADHRGDQGDDE
jgi:hypothetical protein